MITVFDVETSFQITEDGKKDPSAKNPNNFLVCMGINDEYVFFKHNEFKGIPNKKIVQDILDKTKLLIGHNIKFDLTFDMMEGSKTGKAAEADVIIGVGHRDKLDTDERIRSLAISKNKITGWHGQLVCTIVPELSRYDL